MHHPCPAEENDRQLLAKFAMESSGKPCLFKTLPTLSRAMCPSTLQYTWGVTYLTG